MRTVTAEILPAYAMSPDDVRDLAQWITSIPNGLDEGIAAYPRLTLTRALADGEPYMYCPLHPVLMFESLAPRPGTSVMQVARGLQALSDLADDVGKMSGHAEAFFITSSPEEMALAERRGWTAILHDRERGQWLMKRKLPPVVVPASGLSDSSIRSPQSEHLD
jgi:hypothetical protein